MSAPCEFAVKHLYPIVRSELTKILTNKFKLTQIEIADKLRITQAAVSQYISDKRGAHIKSLPKDVQKIIIDNISKLTAVNTLEDVSSSYLEEAICNICRQIKALNKHI